MIATKTIEAVVLIALREHYKAASWAYRDRDWSKGQPTNGAWRCACGASGVVRKGEQATHLHREHVARIISSALSYGGDVA